MSIFKRKPKYHIEIGGGTFVADFYVSEKEPDVMHNYLHIYTPNGVFEIKIVGFPYGYLLTAVTQGNEEEVHNYCVLLWRISQEIYQEAGFANDIVKAITKRDKRLLKKAEIEAKKTSDAQIQADEALLNDVIAEQSLSKKELKKKRAEDKALLREILTEKEDNAEKSADN